MNQGRVATTLMKATLATALVASCAVSLQGCALLAVGAVGGGAMVATDRRTVGTQTDDREIQVKVIAQMHGNMPDAAHVNVNVFNKRVLLTGEVPNDAAKQTAEQLTRGVTNVQGVANELVVAPASSFSDRANDTYLEGRAKSEIIATKGVSANHFKLVCERSVIYLMGMVTREEGDLGANAAASIPGVVQVVKLLQYIQPGDDGSASATGGGAAPAAAAPAPLSSGPADAAQVGTVPIDSGTVTSSPIAPSQGK
jgi:osmotically-inducible protein OsmY